MKKVFAVALAMTVAVGMLAGCGSNDSAQGGAADGTITVVSREDGSGTRGAFIELFGIEEKNDAGEKIDNTTDTAEITNSTAVMMTTVAGNDNAIGYVSLGSLNDSVKALSIDEVEASAENIKNGTYAVARPFNIATGKEVSISQGNTGAFKSTEAEGKIVVAGSSSVTPVMEKLKEAYLAINPNATIEVQQSDSTTGMTSVMEGMCDIGMASRELKDSELAAGLTPTVIAMDGIAVVVNHNNTVDNLTSEQVKEIFTGKLTDWSAAQ